jgi:hypothetical protein
LFSQKAVVDLQPATAVFAVRRYRAATIVRCRSAGACADPKSTGHDPEKVETGFVR